MEIYLGNHVFLPYGANWKTRPKVSLGSLTNSRETPVGGEVRATAWATLRRTLEWTITGRDGEECGRIEETVRAALAARCAGAPNWLAARSIASVAGNVITLDTEPDLPLAQGTVLWFGGLGSAAYGLCTVASAVGRSVTLVAAPAGITAGMQIAPLILGTLDSDPDVSEIHGAARSWALRLTESGDLHGLSRAGSEAMGLGLSVSGSLKTFSPNGSVSDAAILGISISGGLVTVVVSGAVDDAATLGISLSGTLAVVVVGTSATDAANLGITLSGTLT